MPDRFQTMQPTTLSRRNFLLGRRTAEPGPQVVLIGSGCLAANGVVCRSCAESCDAGAIRFRLQLGGIALAELDATRCTGCAECLPACPTRALVLQAVPTSPTLTGDCS